MNLEWKSNARYGQNLDEGSIFELKDNRLGISIHHYVGCGNNWYLSCKALKMSGRSLDTEDFNDAVNKAKEIINKEVAKLMSPAMGFYEGEENILVRY